MDTNVTANPYLAGNYAPVPSEEDFTLAVTGRIPDSLAGVLYRNGPNPQYEPRDENHHWFIGDGMIHAFAIENGNVTYRNRWIRTEKFKAERAAGHALLGSWGSPLTTDPDMLATGRDDGLANTNIVFHAGRLLALEEAHAPFEIQPRTLESRGRFDLGGRVTAHPKIDPATGEMIFFAYADDEMPLTNRISWGIADATGRLLKRESFDAPYCSMIHDFMVTEHYVMIPVLPLRGDMERAMQGGTPFSWDQSKPALIAVMRRDRGVASLRWFQTAACYIFHVMNAFEQDGALIADVMEYESAPLFPRADGTQTQDAKAKLTRWRLDLADATNTVHRTALDDLAGEFPRIDPRYEGRGYTHGWFAGATRPAPGIFTDSLAHMNFTTGCRATYTLPAGDAVSEPVFVPASQNALEGQGWLLAVAYRARENASELLVLDAQDIAAGPVALATLPRRVPFGFHGNWVAGG